MALIAEFPDGYYWARNASGSAFVVLRECGQFYSCGDREPCGEDFRAESQIIMAIPPPVH